VPWHAQRQVPLSVPNLNYVPSIPGGLAGKSVLCRAHLRLFPGGGHSCLTKTYYLRSRDNLVLREMSRQRFALHSVSTPDGLLTDPLSCYVNTKFISQTQPADFLHLIFRICIVAGSTFILPWTTDVTAHLYGSYQLTAVLMAVFCFRQGTRWLNMAVHLLLYS
jgi:hypothetical protein